MNYISRTSFDNYAEIAITTPRFDSNEAATFTPFFTSFTLLPEESTPDDSKIEQTMQVQTFVLYEEMADERSGH